MQLHRFCLLVVRIVLHKKADINDPAKPHQPGLQQYQKDSIGAHQAITYVTGAVPKHLFQVVLLVTDRAVIMHIENMGEFKAFKRIAFFEHGPTPATGTFHG